MAEIEIVDKLYEALRIPDGDREQAVKTELAISLYDRGILPFGKARALAGLSKRDVHRLLGDRRIDRHYTDEELALIGRLDLLEAQFDAVEAPEQVWRELTRGEERVSDLRSYDSHLRFYMTR